MSKLPIVALIGQTNAGKSSLLNRFARKNIAIIAREAGTTRDNVTANIDDHFLLVDTAGLKDPTDDFEATIQNQILDAIDTADLILLTLDSTKYPSHEDLFITRQALRSQKPVLLLLNKADLRESLPIEEFYQLGIKTNLIFFTSATTGKGITELKQCITTLLHDQISAASKITSPDLTIALIGRPNVGKSSFFNAIAQKQQALVSSKQGTTRDINRVRVKFNNRTLEFLDTAGLRRQGRREVGIEKFSAIRTLSAIEEADICALLIDATEPHVKLDQALAGQIVKAGKSILLVITKTDLLDNPQESQDAILRRLTYDFNFIPYAPALLTSSLTGKNITKIFQLIETIHEARTTTLKTSDLNRILTEAVASHTPAGLKNTKPKMKYMVQTDSCPPWFVIHGQNQHLVHWSYKRFLERKIREFYPFIGTPIFLSFRNHNRDKTAEK